MENILQKVLGGIFLVIGLIIILTFVLQQAPTVAGLTSTATGSSLANAGITSNTLAGTIYGFDNVLYALIPFGLIGGTIGGFFYLLTHGGKHR